MADTVETVESWMSRDPVSIEPEASAEAALELMLRHGIRHLPVVDPNQHVVGILSIDDLRAALPIPVRLDSGLSPEDRELVRDYVVGEIMVHAPELARRGTSLQVAARRLADRHIGCLPVVDSRAELVGILSETDALRALVATLEERRVPEPKTELEALETALRAERARIRRRLESGSETERDLSAEQHDLPMDDPERGSDLQQVALAETLGELSARRLDALDRALDHAAQGRLGVCDGCGGGIPIARLRALPGTTLCVACARAAEAGERSEMTPNEPTTSHSEWARLQPEARVYTPQGEGRLLGLSSFGTCGLHGESEGRQDAESGEVLCSAPGCDSPLADVGELAVVELGDETILVEPEKLRAVDPAPYD